MRSGLLAQEERAGAVAGQHVHVLLAPQPPAAALLLHLLAPASPQLLAPNQS